MRKLKKLILILLTIFLIGGLATGSVAEWWEMLFEGTWNNSTYEVVDEDAGDFIPKIATDGDGTSYVVYNLGDNLYVYKCSDINDPSTWQAMGSPNEAECFDVENYEIVWDNLNSRLYVVWTARSEENHANYNIFINWYNENNPWTHQQDLNFPNGDVEEIAITPNSSINNYILYIAYDYNPNNTSSHYLCYTYFSPGYSFYLNPADSHEPVQVLNGGPSTDEINNIAIDYVSMTGLNIIWSQYDSWFTNTYNLYYTNGSIGNFSIIDNNDSYDKINPTIYADNSDQIAYVAWEKEDGSDHDIWLTQIDMSDGSVSASDSFWDNNGESITPAIAANENDNIVIVWEKDEDIYLREVGSNVYYNIGPYSSHPHICADPNGSFHIVSKGVGYSIDYTNLDKTHPEVTLEYPLNGDQINGSLPEFSWNATDYFSGVDHYSIYIDDMSIAVETNYTETTYTPDSPLAAGSHTWKIRAYDVAGNYADSDEENITITTPDDFYTDYTGSFIWGNPIEPGGRYSFFEESLNVKSDRTIVGPTNNFVVDPYGYVNIAYVYDSDPGPDEDYVLYFKRKHVSEEDAQWQGEDIGSSSDDLMLGGVALAPNGDICLVWEYNNEIKLKVYENSDGIYDSSNWGSTITVSSIYDAANPSVAVNSDGVIAVAYTETRTGTQHITRTTLTGYFADPANYTSNTTNLAFNDTDATAVNGTVIAANGTDAFAIFYTEDSDAGDDNPNNDSEEPYLWIPSSGRTPIDDNDTVFDIENYDIVGDSSGNFHAAVRYTDAKYSNTDKVAYIKFDSNGNIEAIEQIGTADGDDQYRIPSIHLDADENVLFTFRRRTAPSATYCIKRDANGDWTMRPYIPTDLAPQTYQTQKTDVYVDSAGNIHTYCVEYDRGQNVYQGVIYSLDLGNPEEFNLLSPADGSYATTQTVDFSWEEARDVTDVTYTLKIDGASVRTEINDTFTQYTFAEGDDGQAHTWQIIASDSATPVHNTESDTYTLNLDASVPTITSVWTDTSPESYTYGDPDITIYVVFSEDVVLTDNGDDPILNLNTGGSHPYAEYDSVSGDTITFIYEIKNDDNCDPLEYVDANSLSLEEATLEDEAGNDVNPALPAINDGNPNNGTSLSESSYIIIDTTDPDIDSNNCSITNNETVTVTFTEGVYNDQADDLEISDFDDPTIINDQGYINDITITSVSHIAGDSVAYLTIEIIGTPSGDESIEINPDSSYSIYDATGLNMSSNATTGQLSLADLSAPTITRVYADADGSYGYGETVEIKVEFSEEVYVNLDPTIYFLLETGQSTPAPYLTGDETNTLTFRYTVGSNQNSADLNYAGTAPFLLGNSTIADNDGYAADLDISAPPAGSLSDNNDIVVDTSDPYINSFAQDPTDQDANPTIDLDVADNYSGIEEITITIDGELQTVDSGIDALTYIDAYEWPSSLQNGDYEATITITDNVGLIATDTTTVSVVAELSIDVDDTPDTYYDNNGSYTAGAYPTITWDSIDHENDLDSITLDVYITGQSQRIYTYSVLITDREFQITDELTNGVTYYAKVSVVDDQGNDAYDQTADFTVDSVAPQIDDSESVISADENDPMQWNFTLRVEDISAIDNGTLSVYVEDNGNDAQGTLIDEASLSFTELDPQLYPGVYVSSTENIDFTYEGQYYYRITLEDNLENAETTANEYFDVAIPDTTPPTVSSTVNPAAVYGDWYDQNIVTVTITAADDDSGVERIYYNLDESGYVTGPVGHIALVTIDANIDGEGEHPLSYYAIDNDGNGSEDNAETINVNIDRTDPTITNFYQVSTDTRPELYYDVADADSGIYSVKIIIDGIEETVAEDVDLDGDLGNSTSGYHTWGTDLANGTYGAILTVTDQVGRVYLSNILSIEVMGDLSVDVDDAPADAYDNNGSYFTDANPTISWNVDNDNDLASIDISVWEVNATIPAYTYSLNDLTLTSYEIVDALDNGTDYYVKVAVEDVIPNSAYGLSNNFTVDAVAPALTSETMEEDQGNSFEWTYSAIANEACGIANATLYVYHNDGQYHDHQSISFTARDPNLYPNTYDSSEISLSFDTAGDYYYYVVIEDNLGNSNTTASTSFTVTSPDVDAPIVDTPEVSESPAYGDWYNETSVTVTLTATDALSGVYRIYYSTDDGDSYDYVEADTYPHEFTDEGENTLTYYAEDKAGNTSDPASIDINIDTTNATVSEFKQISTDSTPEIDVEVEDAGSGIKLIRIIIDGSAEVVADDVNLEGNLGNSYSDRFEWPNPLVNGTYTAILEITDLVGNLNYPARDIQITVSDELAIDVDANPSPLYDATYTSANPTISWSVDNDNDLTAIVVEFYEDGNADPVYFESLAVEAEEYELSADNPLTSGITYHARVTVEDGLNLAYAETEDFIADATAPSLDSISVAADPQDGLAVTISTNALEEHSGLASATLYVYDEGGIEYNSYSLSIPEFDPLAEITTYPLEQEINFSQDDVGNYYCRITLEDNLENSYTSDNETFTVSETVPDTTAPSIDSQDISEDETDIMTWHFNFDVLEEESGLASASLLIKYTADNTEVTTNTYTIPTPTGGIYTLDTVDVTFDDSTEYTWELTVEDLEGNSETYDGTITVNAPLASVAVSGDNETVTLGESITLTAATNLDDQSGVTFTWSEGLGDGESVVFTPNTAGSYTISVTADYHEVSVNAEIALTVNPIVESITISKDQAGLLATGTTLALSATVIGQEELGVSTDLTSTYATDIAWSGAASGTGSSIDFSAQEDGYYEITASIGSLSDATDVTYNGSGPSVTATCYNQVLTDNAIIPATLENALAIQVEDLNGIENIVIEIDGQEVVAANVNMTAAAVNNLSQVTAYSVALSSTVTLDEGTHTLSIKAYDYNGLESITTYSGLVVSNAVTITDTPFNYPNPFQPASGTTTTIRYTLSAEANIKIMLYDMTGRMVWSTLCTAGSEGGKAGLNNVPFDGTNHYGTILGNGVYLYLITCDGGKIGQGQIAVYQ